MCWNIKGWVYKRAYYGYETKFERKHPLIIQSFLIVSLLTIVVSSFIFNNYVIGSICLIVNFILILYFTYNLMQYIQICKAKKEHKLLCSYYFCSDDLIYLRKKYFNFLRELIDIQTCFYGNEELLDYERTKKLKEINNILYNYLTTNKTAKREFEKAYSVEITPKVSNLILQSILADYVIRHKQYLINIFLSKQSILYSKEYPVNYQFFKIGRHKTILDYIEFRKIQDDW